MPRDHRHDQSCICETPGNVLLPIKMSEAETACHVIVSGLVQGVGFRYRTYLEATRIGLTGWVRNLPDGRVEALFEGPPVAVTGMLEWCQQGPVLARVDKLEQQRRPVSGRYPSFEISL